MQGAADGFFGLPVLARNDVRPQCEVVACVVGVGSLGLVNLSGATIPDPLTHQTSGLLCLLWGVSPCFFRVFVGMASALSARSLDANREL